MKKFFPAVQKLGKSLMLPIAVLPVAGLLLRLGQPDLLDLPYVAAAGNAVFANLGLLFAIGVAVGLARGSNGAAGLAAVVAYLVTTEGAKVLIAVPPEVIADVAERAESLRGRSLLLVCRSGRRSAQACEALIALGVEDVTNLAGGMIAWNDAGLPVEGRSAE